MTKVSLKVFIIYKRLILEGFPPRIPSNRLETKGELVGKKIILAVVSQII
jgi:hypothetical protein